MKTILFVLSIGAFASACGGKKGGDCASAVAKGVDTMMAAGQKRMESMPGGMPADMKATMDEASGKLKSVIANRCTEDKWSAEIIDCYSKAATREDLKACRAKLPADQAGKLQAEEMKVMSEMRGAGGMPQHGMHGGMGGGMGGPSMSGGSGAPAPAPDGSAAPAPAPAGSAAAPATPAGH